MKFISVKRIGMLKGKGKLILIDMLLMIVLIFLDQITKYFAINSLMNQPPIVLVDGVFEFHYLENRGAAFGMLQDQKLFFIFIAIII